ncbi:MAG: hypothetical protein ACRDF9_10020 [Candidatus Limnocylindria bacterium]
MAASLFLATSCGGAPPLATGIDCGTTDERLGSFDSAARECVWNAYTKGEAVHWTLRAYTIEGDPVPYTVAFNPTSGLVATRDTRADRFGGVGNQRVFTYRCQTMTKTTQRDDISRYSFRLTNCTGDGLATSVP